MKKISKLRQKVTTIKSNKVKEEKAPEIAKEMQEFYAALKAIATAHNLLDRGLYKHTEQQAVIDSMVFLRSLHDQVKTQALAHPDADKIPEIADMKKQIAEAAIAKMTEDSKNAG